MDVTVANSIEDFSCSNAENGLRPDQESRSFDTSGSVMVESADTLFEWDLLVTTGTPVLVDATWSYGNAVATNDDDVFNRVSYDCKTVQLDELSYDRAGSKMTAEVSGHCTGTSGGDEFILEFS